MNALPVKDKLYLSGCDDLEIRDSSLNIVKGVFPVSTKTMNVTWDKQECEEFARHCVVTYGHAYVTYATKEFLEDRGLI